MKTTDEKKIMTTRMTTEVKATIQSETNKEIIMSSFRTSGTLSLENLTDSQVILQNSTEAITGKKRIYQPGPVFTNILILRIRIFLEFFLENCKNKYFWYSLNFYS